MDFVYAKYLPVHMLTEKGQLYMWGMGRYGRLGLGNELDQNEPRLVYGLNGLRIKQVALGERHTVAIAGMCIHPLVITISITVLHILNLPNKTETGEVYTWGDSSFGVLGHGERLETDPIIQTTPRMVEYLVRSRKKANQVGCGAYHTLVLTGVYDHTICITNKQNSNIYIYWGLIKFQPSEDGSVFGWGDGGHGVLGQGGDYGNAVEATPVTIASLLGRDVILIACGWTHSAVITSKFK